MVLVNRFRLGFFGAIFGILTVAVLSWLAVPVHAEGTSDLGTLAYIQGGHLWVKDLPDGPPRQLTLDGQASTPLWSPSHQWIVFVKDRQLWVIRRSGADAHRIAANPLGPFAWSPVADTIAFLAQGGLFTVAADGSHRHTVVTANNQLGAGVHSFAWSPDGQQIAYARIDVLQPPQNGQPPVRFAQIVRVHPDGSAAHEIYNAGHPSGFGLIVASWSPDGSQVLFWIDPDFSASLLADGTSLLAVPASGGTPMTITRFMLAYPDFLSWSPSERDLALVDGGGRFTWDNKFLARGQFPGPVQRVTGPDVAVLDPAWSPDGRRLAFVSSPAAGSIGGGTAADRAMAQRRIWMMADSANLHSLTNDPRFRDERPEWSADGTSILFARLQGQQAQLWLMRADGSDQRPVVADLSPGPGTFGYYGFLGWAALYDWSGRNAPRNAALALPTAGGAPEAVLGFGGIVGLALIAAGHLARRRLDVVEPPMRIATTDAGLPQRSATSNSPLSSDPATWATARR